MSGDLICERAKETCDKCFHMEPHKRTHYCQAYPCIRHPKVKCVPVVTKQRRGRYLRVDRLSDGSNMQASY